MDKLISEINKSKINYSLNVDLKRFTYLGTGGNAGLIIYPKNTAEMVLVIRALKSMKILFKVVGATSNLLFLDETRYNCLLSTKDLNDFEYLESSGEIIAGSGLMLPHLSRIALFNSITGFEGLEGIPGTIGGAVFMNAGAYGYEISEILKEVEAVDFNGNVINFSINDLRLEKRNSALRRGEISAVITKVTFNAKKGNASSIENKMEIFHSKRHKYQDFQFPNLGSMFSGSVYRALGDNDRYTYLMSSLFYLLNYKFKVFRRESPINRKWMNDIIVRRFKLKYHIQPFSNKTINCLVNRGQGTSEMVRYIEEITDLTNNSVPLENEIVDGF
ncbi:UDP-N-acetylmuramate dehydrogenase [Maribacter sp. Asnod1-A12]|uniref:UDP-N-acetylmuramate dehydrogenase n=1 Tax=Maribacter sp. Asnod1-A12 TaxID=3160576 RepID=UPI00387072A6